MARPTITKRRLTEIKKRAQAAHGSLREETNSPGWVVSDELSPAGCRILSPHVGIRHDVDYQLFLHARADILELCAALGAC